MRGARAILVVLTLLLLSACAAILGLDPLDVYVPSEEGGVPSEAGVADDGGTTVGEAGEAPCSPTDVPEGPVVHVSAKAGDAGTPTGTAELPYARISDAFARARLVSAKTIAVDEDTYVEDVTVEEFAVPIAIDGAWVWSPESGAWSRDCSPDRRTKTVLRSTQDVGLRVRNQASIPVKISNLTIETRATGATAPDTSGASRYGVFVDSSLLLLENVRVVAHGGDPAGQVSPGTPGVSLCATSTDCVASPQAGIDRADADPASTFGTFGADGFTPGAGQAGADGTNGTNGTPGGAAAARTDCFNACMSQPSCEVANLPVARSSTAGQCGCGGSGGKKGQPGRGGGASVAIYAVGASALVSISYSELLAGAGGDGSPGGQGGAGGAATAGVPGTSVDCYENRCCRCGDCPDCGCWRPGSAWPECCVEPRPQNRVIPGGAAGGAGMRGGKGANGGGGAGGPSFAFVELDGAKVEVSESSRTFGPGGSGAGGAPNGPAGEHP